MAFYIYILYSQLVDKYYVGHNSDITARIEQHLQNDSSKYTGKFKDWEIKSVFYVSEERGDAMRLEKFIKKQKSRKLIEQIINEEKLEGELAQLVRVPHVRD
jgi:putative endonuclease